MAGAKINEYGVADKSLTALMASADAQRIGFCALSLTEYATTSEPAIAAGSKIECNGALFGFDTELAITGSPADGEVYIIVKPDGSSITAEYTTTAPTYSATKFGWYGTGDNANYRYVGSLILDAAEYRNKYVYINLGYERIPMTFATLSEFVLHETMGEDTTYAFVFTFEWDVDSIINTHFNVCNDSATNEYPNIVVNDIDITDEVVTITVQNYDTATVFYNLFCSCTAMKKIV